MTKQPRLADVAKAAGVSTATASMALNDTGGRRIGSETRERVRAAAAELGYRPNTVARGLRTRKTQMIGFVGDDVATTPFAGQMIRGAHDAAREAGYLLLMVDTMGDPAETGEAIAALQERQIDGILLATMYHQVLEVPKIIGSTPCVLLDARTADGSVSSVVPDERGGTLGALVELSAAGHRSHRPRDHDRAGRGPPHPPRHLARTRGRLRDRAGRAPRRRHRRDEHRRVRSGHAAAARARPAHRDLLLQRPDGRRRLPRRGRTRTVHSGRSVRRLLRRPGTHRPRTRSGAHLYGPPPLRDGAMGRRGAAAGGSTIPKPRPRSTSCPAPCQGGTRSPARKSRHLDNPSARITLE